MKSNQPNGRLISWKEIAHYLQCEERTAQRWERERALPVHRIPGDKRGSVYAFRAEIDAWLTGQGNELVPAEASGEPQSVPNQPAGRIVKLYRFALAFTIVFALAFSWVLWSKKATHAGLRKPAFAEYSGPNLIIKDLEGKELWRHKFPSDLIIPDERPDRWHRIQFADLDGDGSVETIAALGYRQESTPIEGTQSELVCFSGSGTLLWRFAPQNAIAFGEKVFGPPFRVSSLLVSNRGDSKQVWVSFVHNTWWPSVLVKLDPQGKELTRFVNSGYIYSLAEVRNSAGQFIIAGGVNNEYDAGMLAVVSADYPTGSSPQTLHSPYECHSCPAGKPFRYFIFPRSELNRASPSPYNKLDTIQVSDDNIKLMTREVVWREEYRAEAVFEFSPELELLSARPGDAYWDMHRIMEKLGRVEHSVLNCRERTKPVFPREWSDGTWHELHPKQLVTFARP